MSIYDSEEEYLKDKINKLVEKGVFVLPKGDKGDKPVAGIDFPIPKDGKNYILTEKDKQEIAKSVKVPIVQKIVEKTEIIKEVPIVTNNVVEVAKYQTGEEIVNVINELPTDEDRLLIGIEHIKDLPKELKNIKLGLSQRVFVGGPRSSATSSSSPALPLNSVQHNKAGIFAGSSQFTYEEDGSGNPLLSVNKSGSNLLLIDFANGNYSFGATNGDGNGNGISISDVDNRISFTNNANDGAIEFEAVSSGAGANRKFTFLQEVFVPDITSTGLAKSRQGLIQGDSTDAYQFKVQGTGPTDLLVIDALNGSYAIGDIGVSLNGTAFVIDDASNQFLFQNIGNSGAIDMVASSSGEAYFNFKQFVVNDEPTTTNNDISSLSYTSGQLTGMTYASGTTKTFTYNVDGTLDTAVLVYNTGKTVTKTASYSGGQLSAMSVAVA